MCESETVRKQIFYVDGEGASTQAVEAILGQLALEMRHFDDAADCVGSLVTQECNLLISNSRWPGVEGMELLLKAKRIAHWLPVVLLVDHGDIQTAVCAMKGGAADCVERPPQRERLTSTIESVLQGAVQNSAPRENPLSKTEGQVLRLILQGNTTAEVAGELHRSRRTVEVHRSHIMQKLEVYSVVDLVRTCLRMGLLRDWP